MLCNLNIAATSTYTQICVCVVYASVRDSVFKWIIGNYNRPTAVKGPETEPEVAVRDIWGKDRKMELGRG